MDVVVLVGGRGRRMGALTLRSQKGALRFRGIPLVCRVISEFLYHPAIETIWVLGGYNAADLFSKVEAYFRDAIDTRKIRLVDVPDTAGTLSRLAGLFVQAPEISCCIVSGVDTLVPPVVLDRMISRIHAAQEKHVLVCASPYLDIAPSHWLVHMRGEIIDGCQLPRHVADKSGWYSETSRRFLPEWCVEDIRSTRIPPDCYLLAHIQTLVARGKPVEALLFDELWLDFSYAKDFRQDPLP